MSEKGLVERLRDAEAFGCHECYGPCGEAADEIERLQAELADALEDEQLALDRIPLGSW